MGCRHPPKHFHNVHNLEFRKDVVGNPTKTAIGILMPRNRPVDSHVCSDTALLALMDLVRELLSEESAR